jgi:flagellar biosynthetic protein FliO
MDTIPMNKRSLLPILSLLLFFILQLPLSGQPIEPPPAGDEATAISFLGDDSEKSRFMEQFIHMLMSLGFILALIFVVAWILKRLVNQRLQQQNTTSNINVIERRALSPKAAVYLLEINDMMLVVGESPTGLHAIAQFPATGDTEPKPQGPSFGTIYEKTTTNDKPNKPI